LRGVQGYKQADVFFVKSSAIKSVLSMKYDDKYTVLEEGSAYKPMTDGNCCVGIIFLQVICKDSV